MYVCPFVCVYGLCFQLIFLIQTKQDFKIISRVKFSVA